MDAGREPKCPPNPAWPDGMDIDMSDGAERTCTVALPFPAPRCGLMMIECGICGLRAGVTVAGRRDDPRSIRLGCRLHGQAQ